ncbi:uncharacterized protein SCHCODRAFT_02641173 [Schizophyllum commune H4-8]|nr:uncharacterized protein SCHCODRAFT_02641173 [Schizophyllum commune H4-8]KAI5887280.1 hypothetical protein SCHCODRAFT_02641173 [Schizophyllum commune H4-8]
MDELSEVAESAGSLNYAASNEVTLSVMISNAAATLNRAFVNRARAMGLCPKPTSLLGRIYAYWNGPAPCTIRDVLATVLCIIGKKVGVVLYGLCLVLYCLICTPFYVVMLLFEGLKYCAKSKYVQIFLGIIAAYFLARAVLRLLWRIIVAAARCALIIGLVLSPVIALAILNPAAATASGAGIGKIIAQASPELIAAAVGVALTPFLGPLVLSAAGFTSSGVAAGSMAAWVHSMIGNVLAGSFFAGAQAAGATGAIPAIGLAIAGGVGGVTAFVAGLFS